MELGRSAGHGLSSATFEAASDNFLIDDIFFPFSRKDMEAPTQKPAGHDPKKAPLEADKNEPIPLPYYGKSGSSDKLAKQQRAGRFEKLDVEEFEEEFDLLGDNAPLFRKLRESENNRKIKMREALAKNKEASGSGA